MVVTPEELIRENSSSGASLRPPPARTEGASPCAPPGDELWVPRLLSQALQFWAVGGGTRAPLWKWGLFWGLLAELVRRGEGP